MAWQYVGGTSGAGTSNGYTVSLTGLTGGIASAPAEGDLVVVLSGFGNTAGSAPNISGNNSGAYTPATAAQHVNDTWDTEFRSFYAVMGATPDTSLTVTRTTSTAYGGATVVQVWRGVDTASPFIGAATPASGASGNAINPPSYDPGETDALVIAGGAGTIGATAASGYTALSGSANTLLVRADGSTADIGVVMGSYAYAGAAVDPAAATGATTSTSASWAGVTLGFRMAPGPITGDLLVQETGTDTFTGDGSVEASEVTGDLVASESGSDTATLSGVATVAGAFSTQEAGADTFTAVGSLPIAGTLAAQDGADILAVNGVVAIAGSGITSESGSDTFTGNASTLGAPVEGSISAQETGPDLFLGAGNMVVAGALAAQDGADSFTGGSAVLLTGSAALAEGDQDVLGAAVLVSVAGYIAANEQGADLFGSNALVVVSGSLGAQEAIDMFSGAAAVALEGSLSTVEAGPDVFHSAYVGPQPMAVETLDIYNAVTGGGPWTQIPLSTMRALHRRHKSARRRSREDERTALGLL